MKAYFGLGNKIIVPPGWKLEEVCDDWAFIVSPEGKMYLPTVENIAYPVISPGRIDTTAGIDLSTLK